MSRRPKKRTKKYAGDDAKQFNRAVTTTEPVIHKYEAVERSRLGQWWFDKKKTIRIVAIVVAIIALAVWMVAELISIIF